MPVFIHPTASIAADALLPADPGHALLLAKELLEAPRMSNHHHGLWGYHGETRDGRPLTVQSTGIGGPSAAVVLHELHELGVRRALRVGACAALDGRVAEGEVIVVERALAADGVSGALGRGGAAADRALTRRLVAAAGRAARAGVVASTDLFYGARYDLAGSEAQLPAGGASPSFPLASDLESAALLVLGARLGVAVAALLIVGDRPSDEAVASLGRAAAGALTGSASGAGRGAGSGSPQGASPGLAPPGRS